jgi:asparagine synthase (glutamine-hydrolysing)
MCGIFCLINKKNEDINLSNIYESLKLRGPDDYSYIKHKNVILLHTRLSIQTTSNLGKQPYEYGNSIIIFNGEIYNFNILAKKYNIDCNIDTDLIIKLYEKYSKEIFINIIKEFEGIFTFIILNKTTNNIFITKDLFGVKPLYWFENDNYICYSSSIKTFFGLNNDINLNLESIYEFFNFRQCLGNKTILNNINSFESGFYTEINILNYEINKFVYDDIYNYTKETYTQTILENKLNDAIYSNLLCDKTIKIGCFLSGGLDSSYIYEISKKNNPNIYSYSIGLENCNEFEFVNKLIKNNSNHKNITITMNDYLENMIELINIKGYPLQVPNEVLISLISKEAKKDGLKVLLAGEGADEIFHGYGKIFNLFLKEKNNFIEKFVENYKYIKNDNLLEIKYDKQKMIDFFSNFDNNDIHKQDLISKIFLNFHIQGLTNRLDSASMANSIEARVPFLNQSFVKYVFNCIPRNEKIKREYDENLIYENFGELSETKDTPKYCLKKIAEEILPNDIIYRKKVGFIVPIEDINNKDIIKIVYRILSLGSINKYEIINKDYIIKKIIEKSNDMKYIIFNLINFEIFIQLFIEHKNIDEVKSFIFKKNIIGYTCGVYDLFHVGHLNLLERSKSLCDYLIVAITTDEKVAYKNKKAYINQNDRLKIVDSIKYVDKTVFQDDHDKFKAWEKYKFDILIVGDDWKGHPNWNKWETQLNQVGVGIVYLPYTSNISSTLIKIELETFNCD